MLQVLPEQLAMTACFIAEERLFGKRGERRETELVPILAASVHKIADTEFPFFVASFLHIADCHKWKSRS